MNTPDNIPSTNSTPESVLPAGYEKMIAESNAKRALGGLAYGEAVREEREHDTAGTFPGSIKSDIISEKAPAVVNLHSDPVESEEELEKSVTRHPASKMVRKKVIEESPELLLKKTEPSVEIEKTMYTNPNYSDAANRRQREADSAYLKSKGDSRNNRGRGPGY